MDVPFTRRDEALARPPFPFALSESEGAQRPTTTSKGGAAARRRDLRSLAPQAPFFDVSS